MSETPRTDAKEKETKGRQYDHAGDVRLDGLREHANYGWKFARQLERELAATDAEHEHSVRALADTYQVLERVRRERDALRAENERLRGALSDVQYHCISLADAQVIAMQALQEPTP